MDIDFGITEHDIIQELSAKLAAEMVENAKLRLALRTVLSLLESEVPQDVL